MSRTRVNPKRLERIADQVEEALAKTPRRSLYMEVYSGTESRMFLGRDGKWVKNRGHARRFDPEQARRFLAKARPVTWTVS